jgi:hypothetical protein
MGPQRFLTYVNGESPRDDCPADGQGFLLRTRHPGKRGH